jgi:hypothetical protein
MASPAIKLLTAAGGTPFDPLSIAGCEWWLDASDEATITDSSGAVSQWDDKSGNSRHATQGTSGERPTTGTRTQNGLNVIDFDGTDDGLDYTAFIFNSTGHTLFFVASSDADPSVHAQLFSETENGLTEYCLRLTSTGAINYVLVNSAGSVRLNLAGDDFGTSNPVVFTATLDRNEGPVTVRVNDAAEDSTTWTSSGGYSFTAASIGTLPNTNGPRAWNGWIGEVIVYDTLLDSADQQDVRDYLYSKWGITP